MWSSQAFATPSTIAAGVNPKFATTNPRSAYHEATLKLDPADSRVKENLSALIALLHSKAPASSSVSTKHFGNDGNHVSLKAPVFGPLSVAGDYAGADATDAIPDADLTSLFADLEAQELFYSPEYIVDLIQLQGGVESRVENRADFADWARRHSCKVSLRIEMVLNKNKNTGQHSLCFYLVPIEIVIDRDRTLEPVAFASLPVQSQGVSPSKRRRLL